MPPTDDLKPETGEQAAPEKFFTTPLLIISVTVFIDLIGFGMVIPILPFYAETPPFNATPFEIGMLFAIYSWVQFFFTPILGRLSDIYGRRPILFISLLGSALGYFVIGIAGTLPLVFLGRIISGITGGNISTAQAYIADVTSRENRAKGMGLFGAAFGLGFILGPAIAGILSKYGIHVPFYFAAVLSLLNATALYFVLPESIKPGAAAVKKRKNRIVALVESFREFEFGLINLVYFLLITAFSIMTYAFVLYTSFTFGYTAEQNGYLFAYVGLIAIVGQGVLFGVLAHKFGEAYLAVAGCLIMAVSLFAVPYVGPLTGGLVALLVGTGFMSFGNALASPALTSLVSKIAHESEQGQTLGIMQSGASLARAIGPTIGGFLLNNSVNKVDTFTIFRTFWTSAGIMFVAFLVAAYFARAVKVRRAAAEDQLTAR
jgi:DHA1 family tetracycline resistance protein-like MFS transporter